MTAHFSNIVPVFHTSNQMLSSLKDCFGDCLIFKNLDPRITWFNFSQFLYMGLLKRSGIQ